MKMKFTLLFAFIIIANFALSAQIPTDGLVRYYPFTGTAMDFSGNDQDGIVRGATLTADRFGTTRSAYNFDGNDSIEIPSVGLDLPEYTYSVWVSLNDLPSYDSRYLFLSVGSSGGDQGITYNTSYYANGNVFNGWGTFSYNGISSVDTIYSQKQANINQWYHLVVTRSSNALKLFVNNIEINNVPLSSSPYYGSGILSSYIGLRQGGWLYSNAKIDDVRIYNRALTSDEVNNLYNEGFCNQLITVTDQLVINLIKTGFNPVTYENSVSVYPNPTSEFVTINYGNYESMKGCSVKLIDSQGVVQFLKKIESQESTIDITTLPLGIYFLQFVDSNSRILSTKKILLQ